MAAGKNDDGRDVGDEIHSDVSGHVQGSVFQGRDFGNINVGASFPEEVATYYRRMQERLDEEERLKEEERERYRKSLIAERGPILLRLTFSIAWFILGNSVTYDDSLPFLPGVFAAAGFVVGPLVALHAIKVLVENIREMNDYKNEEPKGPR
ncbi:hypothetical protein HCC61_23920 [Streptomyces sp. HNM0575]|uniref:hypothetical protein n=1 Tax=Streptomyces sp. HNM0575 TaxID=2716338 RepID=UPI00145D7851|nr:hypothetical protein [Streptomyces sp. HNM0575]NLU75665.1 hypothetical protein [Streptomyces sp. HNM0575]